MHQMQYKSELLLNLKYINVLVTKKYMYQFYSNSLEKFNLQT
jgi:hypothetical protein